MVSNKKKLVYKRISVHMCIHSLKINSKGLHTKMFSFRKSTTKEISYFLINRCMAIEEGYCSMYAGEYRNFVLNSNINDFAFFVDTDISSEHCFSRARVHWKLFFTFVKLCSKFKYFAFFLFIQIWALSFALIVLNSTGFTVAPIKTTR